MDTGTWEPRDEHRLDAPRVQEQEHEESPKGIPSSDGELSKLRRTVDLDELLEAQMEYARRTIGLNRPATKEGTRDNHSHSSHDQPCSKRPRQFISRHHVSLQVSRTLFRREQDCHRKYEEQVARGRPDGSWRQCSDPQCWRPRCLYVDLIHMAIWKTTYGKKKRPVARRTEMFLEAMVKHFFGDLEPKARKKKGRLIESFIGSPPVRGALGQFDLLCKNRRWDPGLLKLAKVLTRIRHSVVHLVFTTRLDKPVPDTHCFHGGEWATYPKDWTLQHLAMQFCAVTEAWRRYALGRGAGWDFGSDEAVADLLCAILLDFQSMKKREAVLIRQYNVLRLKESWEKWLDRYHMLRQRGGESGCGGGEAEGTPGTEYYLEGFGRGAISWMSERMKESGGWNTDEDESGEDSKNCLT